MTDEIETCRNGHPRTEANTMYERLPNGKLRRRCRVCRQLRASKNRDITATQPSIAGEVFIDHHVYDTRLLPQADQDVIEKFDIAVANIPVACNNKVKEFSDYGDTPEEIPSPEYAAKLCEGCPLFKYCDRAANAEKTAWGVRAGKVWFHGNIYTGGKYSGSK